MIIYLDESKRLSKGEIVFGGFITKHSVSYINKSKKFDDFILENTFNIDLSEIIQI